MILRRPRPREDQLEVIGEPANEKETKFIETYLKAAENVEMTDQDVEIAENNGTEFKHDSLIEYSNIQLDFIKVFGKRVFVLVIGEFNFFNHVLFDNTLAIKETTPILSQPKDVAGSGIAFVNLHSLP